VPGDDDPGLTADGGLGPGTSAETDVDRFFRDKDLEELTRKTYDAMGLEVRDVLARSDLPSTAQSTKHSPVSFKIFVAENGTRRVELARA
jgi:hypothetical protein